VVGSASWYGQQFHNHHTADGEIFDQYALSAAHKTLPLPCVVEVTNLDNGRKLKLRVNDRGPFVGDRLIDVSRAAAEALGFRDQGLTHVRVRYVGPAPPLAATTYARAYLAPHHLSDEAEPDLEVAAASTRSDGAGPASTTASDLDDDDNPSPPPSAAPAVHAGGFAVQAAAFASRENAQRAAGQLGAVGPASIRPITTNSGLTLYRVMLSGYADANAAEAARGQVVAAGYGDARVIAPF